MAVRERVRETIAAVRSHADLRDSPGDRIRSLLLSMLTSESLPNITLGGAVTVTLNWLVADRASGLLVVAFWGIWVLSVLLYAGGAVVRDALTAAAQEYDADEQTDRQYQ